jgi:hypothetical protein
MTAGTTLSWYREPPASPTRNRCAAHTVGSMHTDRKTTLRIVAMIALPLLATAVYIAAVIWWRHDDRPWPWLLWFAVKTALLSKTVLKVAAAAGLGLLILWRAITRRGREPAAEPTSVETAAAEAVSARPETDPPAASAPATASRPPAPVAAPAVVPPTVAPAPRSTR